MKNKKKFLTLLLICLFSVFVLQTFAQDSLYKKIDEIILAESKYDLFSGTVLVAKDGSIIYSKAFGEANKEKHVLNSLETRFNISSIQKSFTATLIMQLYQDGLLKLDDPLNKFFPECPFKTADQIQIKNLLNHTSGLGDYRSHERYQEEADTYKELTDVLPLVYELPPECSPNEKFIYSNTGYLLLKIIIEKIEKKKFAEIVKQRIFDPLGMNYTIQFKSGGFVTKKAYGHDLSAKNTGYVKAVGEPAAYTGGGIYTTVGDLLKFDQALYTEELLTEENKKLMWTPINPSRFYGFGWVVVPFGGTTVIYHNGGSGGFSSEFRRYPEKAYTIIVLSNYAGSASALTNKIDGMLLEQPYLITTEAEAYCRKGKISRMQNELSVALEYYYAALDLFKQGEADKNIAKEIAICYNKHR
jgi:CubicO group peptidase (beta-lactamase class C family)